MELDKRIKNNHRPLCVIDIKWAMGFIGQNGFFADAINCFENLSECQNGKLVDAEDNKIHPFECDNEWNYMFFIPEEWVKESEKKWRAYTIAEFQETFTVGRAVRFRRKDAPAKEHLLAFGGYYTLHDGRVSILFGIHLYTLEELFEQYEWQEFYTDEYRPFGVEE